MPSLAPQMDLPTTIPIFALPNVVLFPGVPLPLHIFEPRYRDMVRDAIAGQALIGMALLRGDWKPQYEVRPEIFPIGCAGRIVDSEELPGGKFNIVLHGLSEFSLHDHIFAKSYREATIEWRPSGAGELGSARRAWLVDLLARYFEGVPDSPARRVVADDSLSDTMLVNFFSYAMEIEPIEKQALLEASTLTERAELLTNMLEFHLEEARINVPLPDSDRRH